MPTLEKDSGAYFMPAPEEELAPGSEAPAAPSPVHQPRADAVVGQADTTGSGGLPMSRPL